MSMLVEIVKTLSKYVSDELSGLFIFEGRQSIAVSCQHSVLFQDSLDFLEKLVEVEPVQSGCHGDEIHRVVVAKRQVLRWAHAKRHLVTKFQTKLVIHAVVNLRIPFRVSVQL